MPFDCTSSCSLLFSYFFSEDKYSVINTYNGYRDGLRSTKVLRLKEKEKRVLQGLRTVCDAVVATGVCYGPQRLLLRLVSRGMIQRVLRLLQG